MKIIAHRGFWLEQSEKNTFSAFRRALQNGFGIETDFRDANGILVVSHDPPSNSVMTAREFFDLCQKHTVDVPHALNIKADGLHELLRIELKNWTTERYFVFDMSLPDTLGYIRKKTPTYLRCSEYESPSAELMALARGIWLDAFEDEWYGPDTIMGFFSLGKEVCIVSPELHSRPHQDMWGQLKQWGFHRYTGALLCTDFPSEAEEYFRE
jgi:hypothetical protein